MATMQESAINGAITHHLRRTTNARKSCGDLIPIFIWKRSRETRLGWKVDTGYRHSSPIHFGLRVDAVGETNLSHFSSTRFYVKNKFRVHKESGNSYMRPSTGQIRRRKFNR